MTYIIAETCLDVKDGACIDVCPVDCIYTTTEDPMMYIQPDECIDCAACEPVCPVTAVLGSWRSSTRTVSRNTSYIMKPQREPDRYYTRDAPFMSHRCIHSRGQSISNAADKTSVSPAGESKVRLRSVTGSEANVVLDPHPLTRDTLERPGTHALVPILSLGRYSSGLPSDADQILESVIDEATAFEMAHLTQTATCLLLITDGEPTVHLEGYSAILSYPPQPLHHPEDPEGCT